MSPRKALESLGISLEAVREKVEETIGMAGTAPSGSPPFTPRAKKVLELSLREALQLGHSYIGTEHMLLGLVREGEGVAATVLVSLGADLGRVRQQVIQIITGGHAPLGGGLMEQIAAEAADPGSATGEPRCPRCRGSVVDQARFRTLNVSSDLEDADPVSLVVVYCLLCGTTLHMF